MIDLIILHQKYLVSDYKNNIKNSERVESCVVMMFRCEQFKEYFSKQRISWQNDVEINSITQIKQVIRKNITKIRIV